MELINQILLISIQQELLSILTDKNGNPLTLVISPTTNVKSFFNRRLANILGFESI